MNINWLMILGIILMIVRFFTYIRDCNNMTILRTIFSLIIFIIEMIIFLINKDISFLLYSIIWLFILFGDVEELLF